jgi:hypothetical protein
MVREEDVHELIDVFLVSLLLSQEFSAGDLGFVLSLV